jgi:hypothetical protein
MTKLTKKNFAQRAEEETAEETAEGKAKRDRENFDRET